MSELKDLIDSHDVISFDVFDTLIHRLVPHAWSVAKLIELQLRHHDLTKTYPLLGTSFADVRKSAEHISRVEREKFEGDTEVNFDEIYDVLQELLGVDDTTIRALKQIELQTEAQVLYADPVMKKIFEYAKDMGKQIVICSDMYLSRDHIASLLIGCGYELGNIPIYVSDE